MPMKMQIRCQQITPIVAKLKSLGKTSGPLAVARGMRSWGEETRTMIIPVTPKKWGNLRDTIMIEQSGNKLAISAGGPAAPYAMRVHELLDTKIKWSTEGTGPKYLENPINDRMPKLPDYISKELDKALNEVKA